MNFTALNPSSRAGWLFFVTWIISTASMIFEPPLLCGGTTAFTAKVAHSPKRKKIIEWGAEPNAAFFKENISKVKLMPFDGAVLPLRTVNRLANGTPDRRAKGTPGRASFCSVQRCHPSVPAHASAEPARAAAVKNGRFFSGRPQGLFLRAVSTAA